MTVPEKRDTQAGATRPEGHTSEEPDVGELGKPGTPGAGMTPSVAHPADADAAAGADAHAAVHAPATAAVHPDAHDVDESHGHVEPVLGPIDWLAWGYAAAGAAIGLLVLGLFYVALA